jgi:hypothetical protein
LTRRRKAVIFGLAVLVKGDRHETIFGGIGADAVCGAPGICPDV